MTNSDTPLAMEIFSEFQVARMATRRDINLQSQSRGSWDLVFTNYECSLPGRVMEKLPPEKSPVGEDLTLFALPGQKAAPSSSEVRAWARQAGFEVSARGRIKPEIVAAWHAAHPTSSSSS
ncbi:Lsr2 family protein [Streptomyces alfalfae]|uniref:Lsr2 family protein n=2 Tax=Streptomyces alfalfae TaxID=1642299 RepID=A0A7T4U228_9ACTN|nr:Lsr2 family protein [Streptomyces alfalfae]